MGPLVVKRIVFNEEDITAKSASNFDTITTFPLIVAQENTNAETEADGTNPAETTINSRVVGINGSFVLGPTNFSSGTLIRWILYKQPDGEDTLAALTGGLVDGNFHSSNDVRENRELRANTLQKGWAIASDKTSQRIRLFVRRNTLHRLGTLKENDKIVLAIAGSNSAAVKLNGIGNIYVRET